MTDLHCDVCGRVFTLVDGVHFVCNRLRKLEQRIDELDQRTAGLIVVGAPPADVCCVCQLEMTNCRCGEP